eukprot:XP_001690676.1 predicted protein [Chlamydomonas reinhardtii]
MSSQPDSADGAGPLLEPAATTDPPSGAAASPPPPQAAAAAPSSLGSLDRLPPDLLASHVWTQLPRRDRRALRLASRGLARLTAEAVMSRLTVAGWQELQPRDLHHVAACYPRLSRLHLAGLPGNNYLHGHVLASLGKAGAAGLRELVVDTQLCGLPLLGSWEPLPLAGLGGGLTRLELTFEHRHAGAEAALAELGRLRGLRCLALDFMQLGTGSSLWSAGWLLCHVLCRLPALTTLRLPRAFLYDKSHPAYLATLAARLPALRELGLGSAILSEETVVAAVAAGLPHLTHLELYRLNADPTQLAAALEHLPALSVVCCGELSESEAAAFSEAAELQYGVYDSAGSRLRVTRAPGDRSLPARLAVGCSMAQTGWEQ